MLKKRVYKILPYWLIFLSFIISIQAGFFLFSQKTKSTFSKPETNTGKVLGALTSIRGQNLNATPQFVQIGDTDLSKIKAKSLLVFDVDSGQNLIERNTAQKLGIASLTKLLTAFVAYHYGDLNAKFKISNNSVIKISPTLNLIPGDEVKALDLFNSMLIGSSNDAALALSYFVGGNKENFVSLMNLQAKEIGMDNSNFTNPLGFDNDKNYSTAEDLKILITRVEKLAAFSNLGRKKSYDFFGALGKKYFAFATNKLILEHQDIWAVKTGYTKEAGGAMATIVKKQDRKLVILVLGSPNREGDTLELKKLIESSFMLGSEN